MRDSLRRTPGSTWYDSDQDLWVVVLDEGAATNDLASRMPVYGLEGLPDAEVTSEQLARVALGLRSLGERQLDAVRVFRPPYRVTSPRNTPQDHYVVIDYGGHRTPFPIGTGVRLGARTGQVVTWARTNEADARYRQSGDPESLVDAEGPVVRWHSRMPGVTESFFPGQTMSVLRVA